MIDPSDVNIYKPYLEMVDFAIERLQKEGREIVLLDAGCGHSTLLEEQYKQCKKVIGVDLDRHGLNKNNLVDQKIMSDLIEIPLPDNSVDIYVSAWVLEHIKKPKKFIKEVNRLLKPGGYFVFITPNKDGWYAVISEAIPDSFHSTIVEKMYKRPADDTFQTYYKLNSREDIDKRLQVPEKFKKIQFVYNDDPKYIGFTWITRPFGLLWHKIVMTKPMRNERLHLIGLYKKL